MVGDGSSGGGDGSGEGVSRKKRLRQSWVFRATLIFVAINMLGVIALASRGSARPDSCGGGFSGYSGGGGCVSDLNVKSFDAPDPVQVKNRLYYLAEATNKGPDEAFNVTLSELLPAGLQVDWVLTPEDPYGNCSIQGRTVFCNFYEVAVHQKVAVSVVVRPAVPGTLNTRVSVTSNNDDPHPGDNSAQQQTTVTG